MPDIKNTVVVVDDEPIIRIDLCNMLENAGYDVVAQGADGYEAINLCVEHQPDVVLLDIKMKSLDGLSAASVITEECKETAIILLTAYNKGEYLDKAKDCRISSYLVKPIDENQLLFNVELAVARNKELTQYMRDVSKAKARLHSSKVIARAKGLIMKEKGMDEDTAYNHIRSISKKTNMSMEKVADIIIKQYGDS